MSGAWRAFPTRFPACKQQKGSLLGNVQRDCNANLPAGALKTWLYEEEAKGPHPPRSSRRCSPGPDCRRRPSACRWWCPCVWQTWWGSPQSTPSPAESHPLCAGVPPAAHNAEVSQSRQCASLLPFREVWHQLTLHSVTIQGTFSTSSLRQS